MSRKDCTCPTGSLVHTAFDKGSTTTRSQGAEKLTAQETILSSQAQASSALPPSAHRATPIEPGTGFQGCSWIREHRKQVHRTRRQPVEYSDIRDKSTSLGPGDTPGQGGVKKDCCPPTCTPEASSSSLTSTEQQGISLLHWRPAGAWSSRWSICRSQPRTMGC
eukprot:763318-Hanusia_phi.AAC.17